MTRKKGGWTRRTVLGGAAWAPVLGLPRLVSAALDAKEAEEKPEEGEASAEGEAPATDDTADRFGVTPFPLKAVRLRPSPYLTAVESNGRYLLRLEPDRLLHNFHASAGLPTQGEVYGGWESMSLAGHSLGHYLSACSLTYAQTGEKKYRARVEYIVTELARCQWAHGDGYVAGFTRTHNGLTEDGKAIFPEIARGDIRSFAFSLNGAWSPLYTLHKQLAGLLDAHELCGNVTALNVAVALGGYLQQVFVKLSEPQMQQVLVCEYGGLNESFAQLYQRTSDKRWLAVARLLYDRRVLNPLAHQRDELQGLHSNTQVPKLIGLARLHEVTGEARYGTAARFFWEAVTRKHSYVVGGNADRESFELPLSQYVTEQTCEACNTYNMLKLTRHLYQWRPDASYFDYYERAHLNHILAQHDPETGMFAYMMPLMSGARREFSKPFDDFWCCVGTGMESHSKHGDSIYWKRGDHVFVNLYIPSELTWADQGVTLRLRTDYPFAGDVVFETVRVDQPKTLAVSFRVPGWCDGATIKVNGKREHARPRNGYVHLRREWSRGDRVDLQLAMRLRAEPIVDDENLIALLYGPMVMAADMGSADDPFEATVPVLVGNSVADVVREIGGAGARPGSTGTTSQPPHLPLLPFFPQYDRRSAVYFPRMTLPQLHEAEAKRAAERDKQLAVEARSVDVMRFGDPASEHDHALQGGQSEGVLYRGRHGRLARSGGSFEFRMRTTREPLELQATYWGRQRKSRFRIYADGVLIASDTLEGDGPIAFVERSYALPAEVTHRKEFVVFRFEPETNADAGPVFGCRVLPGKPVVS